MGVVLGMSILKQFNVEGLALDLSAIYLGRMLFELCQRWVNKRKEFEINLTFSGAVRYANRMDE